MRTPAQSPPIGSWSNLSRHFHSADELVLSKILIVRAQGGGEAFHFGRKRRVRAGARKAGRALDGIVPCGCPGTIGRASAGWPAEHAIRKRNSKRIAKQRKRALRIAQDVLCVNHRG